MARPPNYGQERKERDRQKAAKKAEKLAAKVAAKELPSLRTMGRFRRPRPNGRIAKTGWQMPARQTGRIPAAASLQSGRLVADEKTLTSRAAAMKARPCNHRRLVAGQRIMAGLQRFAVLGAALAGPALSR